MKLKRELWIRRAKNGFVLKVDIEQVVIYTEKDELLKDLAEVLGPPETPVTITAPYVLFPPPRDYTAEIMERVRREDEEAPPA